MTTNDELRAAMLNARHPSDPVVMPDLRPITAETWREVTGISAARFRISSVIALHFNAVKMKHPDLCIDGGNYYYPLPNVVTVHDLRETIRLLSAKGTP